MLFANQQHLTRANLAGYAKQIGLNLPAFEQVLDRHTYRAAIERDLAEACGLGVTTTPTFFVNGRRLVSPQDGGARRRSGEEPLIKHAAPPSSPQSGH